MEANALELDSSRANSVLEWRPCWTQHEAIQRTFDWWSNVLIQKISPEAACEKDIELFLSRDAEADK
jgi:hypothetical protein